jgi:phage shock protein A
MSLTTLVVVGLLVVVFFVWLAAVAARRKGKVKQSNGVVRLVDAINVQVAKAIGVAVDASTDHVAAAEVDISLANKEVEAFEEEILNLREAVKLGEKKLPGQKAEVAKWENIYLKAVEANDTEGADEAARRLKTADERAESSENLLKENKQVLEQLENQKRELKDGLANADVLKDRLAAQKTSAELRQRAIERGSSAANGLTVLKGLEEEVARSEARAEALEEVEKSENNLEDKYGDGNTAHDERLAALRAKAGK